MSEDFVELGRDGVFVVKLEIPMESLGVEAAARDTETMGELVCRLEHGVGDGDRCLHTQSIPRVGRR